MRLAIIQRILNKSEQSSWFSRAARSTHLLKKIVVWPVWLLGGRWGGILGDGTVDDVL